MRIFKAIDIDLDAERARIHRVSYNKRQRAALLKLCDLFEAGKWQECLNHVNDKKAFPYNRRHEYPEVEHIVPQMADILRDLGANYYYTMSDLKSEIVQLICKKLQNVD